jgi:Glycosyltransferase like family 2
LQSFESGQIRPVRASYVLPIRWVGDEGSEDLTAYLRSLPEWAEVIVVDGSPQQLFEHHAEVWAPLGRHLRPDPALETPMGKVGGVLTGVREASHDAIVVADDDVRYDERALVRAVQLLRLADCVRPQNYFEPVPWHALWDSSRTLLNRSLGADFPGTLAVRRSSVLAAGGYDGDVIFENLELIRTIRAAGGRVITPLDLYVARRPPSARHFLSQRVRQAYDDFAIPPRMAAWLAVVPGLALAAGSGRWKALAAVALGLVTLAEVGRRRAGGRTFFHPTAPLFAPLWVLERGISSWLAVRERVANGGISYGGTVVPRAASSRRRLRRRFATGNRLGDRDRLAAGSTETDQLVGSVAEGLPPRSAAAA